MPFAQSMTLPPPTATMMSQPCSAYTTAPASISSIRGLRETLVNSVHPRPAPSILASTCCTQPARTTPGSETTSAFVPPRLRPYCPANSNAATPKMISGAKNFRKFREYVMALRPSTIGLQVQRRNRIDDTQETFRFGFVSWEASRAILHPEKSTQVTIGSFKRKAPTKPVRLTKHWAPPRIAALDQPPQLMS